MDTGIDAVSDLLVTLQHSPDVFGWTCRLCSGDQKSAITKTLKLVPRRGLELHLKLTLYITLIDINRCKLV